MKGKKDKPIHPFTILIGFFTFMLIYQGIMMWCWYNVAGAHDFLLRFSLSNADTVSIYAFAVAMLAYYYYYKQSVKVSGNPLLSALFNPDEKKEKSEIAKTFETATQLSKARRLQ